jgi:23S rRNA (uracil1939-C5)-methyltransferase
MKLTLHFLNIHYILQINKEDMSMKCNISKKCGSCKYIDLEYKESLKMKYNEYKKLYDEFHIKVNDVIGMDNPYEYRNKVIVAFNNKYEYGLYEENSHRIVPMKQCLLHDEETHKVLQAIQNLFKKYRMSIYDEKRNKGFVKYVLIRRAVKTNQTLVTIVSTDGMFKGSKNFCSELIKKCPSVQTIVLNINKRKTSIVLSKEEKLLYGKGFIVDELCGLTFKISSQSFYQINHEQCEKLYNKVKDLLDVKENYTLLDTYCGIGTIGMTLCDKVQSVIGVELNKEAYKDAIMNAKMNKLNNIKFVNEDATEFMKKNANKFKVDCIVMDPPRSGSTKEFIQGVKKMNPSSVIYVSCDPHTQVRDLREFKKIGYNFKEVFFVDMFPFTSHLESIVLLNK